MFAPSVHKLRPAFALLVFCSGCPKASDPASPEALARAEEARGDDAGQTVAWLSALRGARSAPGGAQEIAPWSLRREGRATVYSFWATDCAPCAREIPIFQALFESGVPVVGVSFDAGRAEAAQALLEARGGRYPNVVLDLASLKEAGRQLPSGLPFTAVIDPNGRLHTRFFGVLEPAQLDAALARAAAGS